MILTLILLLCQFKAMFTRDQFQTDPNGSGPKLRIGLPFTRDRFGIGPERIQNWTYFSAGPILDPLDPFRTGSRTVSCKQKPICSGPEFIVELSCPRQFQICNMCFVCYYCSSKFKNMVDCVKTTVKICTEDKLEDSAVESIVRQTYNDNSMCFEGALEVPTLPPALPGLPCFSSFTADANKCVKSFHQKFVADKSDPSLCE